ncbi:MAG: hypothetical protein AAF458_24295, partial [Pseudomonadota bacterium]
RPDRILAPVLLVAGCIAHRDRTRARARDMPAELVRGWEEGAEAAADRFNPNWRMWSASQPRASKR